MCFPGAASFIVYAYSCIVDCQSRAALSFSSGVSEFYSGSLEPGDLSLVCPKAFVEKIRFDAALNRS